MAKKTRNKKKDKGMQVILGVFIFVIIMALIVIYKTLTIEVSTTPPKENAANLESPKETIEDTEITNVAVEPGEPAQSDQGQATGEALVAEEPNAFETTYYVPRLIVNGDEFVLEDETYQTGDLARANEFLAQSFEKMKQYKNATVTELVTYEGGEEKRVTTQTLREIALDYENFNSKHVVSKKYNGGSPVVLEENYAVSDGIYLSNIDDITQKKMYSHTSPEETLTRDNMLNFSKIELKNRSPFHLVENFYRTETRPNGLKVGENQDFFVFYKEKEEEFFGTKHYEIEMYLFDKMTFEPTRYVIYEKQEGAEVKDYSIKEVIYSDFNNTPKIKVPVDFQSKALGLE